MHLENASIKTSMKVEKIPYSGCTLCINSQLAAFLLGRARAQAHSSGSWLHCLASLEKTAKPCTSSHTRYKFFGLNTAGWETSESAGYISEGANSKSWGMRVLRHSLGNLPLPCEANSVSPAVRPGTQEEGFALGQVKIFDHVQLLGPKVEGPLLQEPRT